MIICHYKKTPIAFSPEAISECINQYTKHKSYVNENFNNADRSKDREIFYRYCDSSKFQKLLKWKPKVSLQEGIKGILKNFYEKKY